MADQKPEACGRCSISTVVDAATDEDDSGGRDPFGESRIEIPDEEARLVLRPQILAGRLKERLDDVAERLTYGAGQ